MSVKIHIEGCPACNLDLPSFHASDIRERDRIVKTIVDRAYHMLHLFGGRTIGLSGLSGRDGEAVIQNMRNEMNRSGVNTALKQVVTGGQEIEIRTLSFLERTASSLGRWANNKMRHLKDFNPSCPGLFLGIDLGVDKIKSYIMLDGKALYKGIFPSSIDRNMATVTDFSTENVARAIQQAAEKTVEIARRSIADPAVTVGTISIITSRAAHLKMIPESKWILEALHNKWQCPVWLHSDREAQALAAGVLFNHWDIAACSLGTGYSVGLLLQGLPVQGPLGVEYFWENKQEDCYKGSTLAYLVSNAELAYAERQKITGALGALDVPEINQAAADKKHKYHLRAVEVVRYLAKHLAWNLMELNRICPFTLAVISGARASMVGEQIVSEIETILTREYTEGSFRVEFAGNKMNPSLTGAYGATLLASAHKQGIDVSGFKHS